VVLRVLISWWPLSLSFPFCLHSWGKFWAKPWRWPFCRAVMERRSGSHHFSGTTLKFVRQRSKYYRWCLKRHLKRHHWTQLKWPNISIQSFWLVITLQSKLVSYCAQHQCRRRMNSELRRMSKNANWAACDWCHRNSAVSEAKNMKKPQQTEDQAIKTSYYIPQLLEETQTRFYAYLFCS